MKKRLFIASSVEGLDAAYAIQENLEHDLEVTVWPQGVFDLSKTSIETLVKQSESNDGAAFIFSPDDVSIVRGNPKPSVRDNVLFELGLFIGSLGREKCFIVKPRSFSALEFPTDLLGVTPSDYDDQRDDGNLVAALGPSANKIRRALLPSRTGEATRPGLEGTLTSRPYRLFFNPQTKRSKRMVFRPEGLIVEGNNKNEHGWRIYRGFLELMQLDGRIHSRFRYDSDKDLFESTDDPDTLSIRGQFMVPDDGADDA